MVAAILWLLCPATGWAQSWCPGDCNFDREVQIDELVTCVGMAMEGKPVDECPAADPNGDGQITVNELVTSIGYALVGCPDVLGELTFDKISMAVFRDGREIVNVTAKDEDGESDDWTPWSSNEEVVRVAKTGDQLSVIGVGVGDAMVVVTTDSGDQRAIPVQVYDPTFIDAGEILIRYVDRFECRWYNFYGDVDASFYQPILPDEEGWHALGSFGIRGQGCPDIDGKQWMIVVKTDPENADEEYPPLLPPTGYLKEWDAFLGFGVLGGYRGAFWTPVCPEDYVAMGTVVNGVQKNIGDPDPPPMDPPSLDDATCVRRDLTVPGEAGLSAIWIDKGTGGSIPYQGSFRIEAPENLNFETTTVYLETGTFMTQGDARSCHGEACWQRPGQGGHEVMNVLAVQPQRLIDAEVQWVPPSLTGCEPPPQFTEPAMTKAIVVPFTAVFGDNDESLYKSKGIPWFIENSPLVRVERRLVWENAVWLINPEDVEGTVSRTWTKGVTDTQSETFWRTVGLSITAETGFKLGGFGAKVSATVSTEVGYETQHAVSRLEQDSTGVELPLPPRSAVGAWRERSFISVKLHNLLSGQFETIQSLQPYDSFNYAFDAYGPCERPDEEVADSF